MLEELIESFVLFASVQHIFFILIGLLIGIIIGAIPGLGPTVVIAIFMPLGMSLPPMTAILFYIGIYVGGIYGGSISAIWINTPGTPAAAATTLDGYSLTKSGKPMKALSAALYASVFGHFFGTTLLFVFSGFIARFGLRFGPPEQCALVLFSLTVISSVSGKDIKKGLFSATLGLLFCTVGLDPITGSRRLAFGIRELDDGINLFAILIGIFAISEVIKMISKLATKRENIIKIEKKQPSSDSQLTLREFLQYKIVLFRSSAIGTFIGSLPGIGTGTAAFVSYAWAKKLSKEPEKFGKGAIEGIFAAEAANNAGCGGALIPLLALGIPGDTVTAVLLGALILHGLTPGPILFMQHINEVRILYLGMFCAGLFLLVFGQVILRVSFSILSVPLKILWPIIMVICTVGVFSLQYSVFDVRMMFLMGLLGYVLNKFEFPLAPLLISFILGPLLERTLRQSFIMFSSNIRPIFNRPIVVFFLFCTIASLLVPYLIYAIKKPHNNK